MAVFRWLVRSLFLLGPAMAHAQGGVVTGAVESFSSSVGTGYLHTSYPIPGHPYVATKKTTSIKKLADGTTITRTSTMKEARDSQGRTVSVTQFSNGTASVPDWTYTTVFDPVEHTTTRWNSQQKQATQFHQLDAPQVATQQARVVAAAKTARESNPTPATETDSSLRPRTKREQLGGKTIAGVYAEGTRLTTTFPIGSIGNDRPIVAVQENWTSPDLKLEVLQTNDDPRNGSSTTEITELDRSEPDSALFQVPEGYTIKDIRPNSTPK